MYIYIYTNTYLYVHLFYLFFIKFQLYLPAIHVIKCEEVGNEDVSAPLFGFISSGFIFYVCHFGILIYLLVYT